MLEAVMLLLSISNIENMYKAYLITHQGKNNLTPTLSSVQ